MKRLLAPIAAFGLVQAVHAQTVFRSSFEDVGSSPATGAVAELRSSSEVVKDTTSTGDWNTFALFPTANIQVGDFIVVYGGEWDGAPLIGEFRLLLERSDAPQRLNAITTLVTAVAGSSLVTGATAEIRLAAAVTLLSGKGLIDADWRNGSPNVVNAPLQPAVDVEGGLQNWVAAIIADLADGTLEPRWALTFPNINGGVNELTVPAEYADWIIGETGQYTLSVSSSLPAPAAGWQYTMLQGPTWVSLGSSGALSYSVPPAQSVGPGTLRIRVTNPQLTAFRDLDYTYRLVAGSVLSSATFGVAGGTLWTPDNSLGMQIANGSLSESTDVQWVQYQGVNNQNVRVFRTQPRDRLLTLPSVLLTPGSALRAAKAACVDTNWETGWNEKEGCVEGIFVRFDNGHGEVVPSKRIPSGAQSTCPALGSARPFPAVMTASTFAALCDTDCSGMIPVLFIHGYTTDGNLGGGSGTWGNLPALIHGLPLAGSHIAAYEFRYRTNARFQDMAADLAAAIVLIRNETGNGAKVRIIAHSFGGLVARTYLQGLIPNAPAISGTVAGCTSSRHPYVESLLTLGTPHSGIARTSAELNGTWLPKGWHGIAGWVIDWMPDSSVWQAGELNPFDGLYSSMLKDFYGVESQAGAIPSLLQRFDDYPLPVPTLSLIGLNDVLVGSSRYGGGDALISFQGQRFAPKQSCAFGACSDYGASSAPQTIIGGYSVGNCVFERVLGSIDPEAAIVPGSVAPKERQTLEFAYKHSGDQFYRLNKAEPVVANSNLAINNDIRRSTHDTMNRVLDWLERQNPDPAATRKLRLEITGPGAIVVDNGGTQTRYDGAANFVSVRYDLDVGPNIRIKHEATPSSRFYSASLKPCGGISADWCDWRVGPYEYLSASFVVPDQVMLNLVVAGSGSVRVQPGNALCSGQCSTSFAVNTPVTLTRELVGGGVWNGWSGACSGNATSCSFTMTQVLGGVPRFVTASFTTASTPPNAGRLNDTGIVWSGHATSGNAASCGGVGHPAGQDCHYGRDALAEAGQLAKIGGGNAGFDYTKISNSGHPLPASATLGSGPNDWACTRDNVTGLIWEVKVNNAAHLRHMGYGYTWYNPNSPDGSPGIVGGTSSCGNTLGGLACNTHTYTQAVNAAGLCGASDWRMPKFKELQGVVDYGRVNPAIDGTYFVNTSSSGYWSGSSNANANVSNYAWAVEFSDGLGGPGAGRDNTYRVRLVRGGQ